MNPKDSNKMRRELEKIAKKNPYNLSEGSNKNAELIGFMNLKIASAVHGLTCQASEEISKIRRANF